ncbi:MAG: iron-sulfur cluster assembly scaffold protein [Mollicutes bacterium PWAP]|nr:iron-sulfur cluster assembly scaffold protein [Mollicutes bacterium PWAP]
MNYKSPNEKRKLIMEHYSKPIMIKNISNVTNSVIHHSNHCVDNVILKINIENKILKEVSHISEGCAIFKSSTDIVLKEIVGKKINEILEWLDIYRNVIENKDLSKIFFLGNAAIFENVSKHYNRLHCAEMIDVAFRKIL